MTKMIVIMSVSYVVSLTMNCSIMSPILIFPLLSNAAEAAAGEAQIAPLTFNHALALSSSQGACQLFFSQLNSVVKRPISA
jgi:hypothetical protein